MKKIHLFLYKYRALLGIVPIVAGILYFIFDPERTFNKWMLIVGICILFLGLCIRIWTAMYNWENINSEEPEAVNGLITNGPYRYCRNPMYFSAIMLTFGFSLIFSSWEVVLLFWIPTILLHVQQIYVEEKFLNNMCDIIYREYTQKVPRLIPYKGKVKEIQPMGKPNWKRGLQRDAGPIFGGIVFVLSVLLLAPFIEYDFWFMGITFGVTIILNFFIVGKIKASAKKIKPIPSTAPPPVLTQPLRYVLFPPKHLLAQIRLPREEEAYTVLDLGCGPGYYTIPIAQMIKGRVIALDIREKMTSITQKRAAKKRVDNISTITGDAKQIPLPDQSVDLICIYLVLGEIMHLTEAIEECRRVLKSNGTISIMESIFDDHYQTLEETKALFHSKGWDSTVTERKRTYYLLTLKSQLSAQKTNLGRQKIKTGV